MRINHTILQPVLTEKATKLATGSVYMFHVNSDANKFQIKEALESLYQVKVVHVLVANRQGKTRRTGKRMQPKQLPNKKIVYVKVKSGKIDLFPQV